MKKSSIYTIEVYSSINEKFHSVSNTFENSLKALELIICNLQLQNKLGHYQAFIQEVKFDANGILVLKINKDKYSMNVLTDFVLTDNINQFNIIAKDLITKMNLRKKFNVAI